MGLLGKLFGGKAQENGFVDTSYSSKIVADIPPFQGDYAKAVFLWAYGKAKPIKKDNEYVRYLLFECGIRSASTYHREMIREGLLQESPLVDRVSALTASKIKDILIDLGLTVTGKKDILVQRLLGAMSEADVSKYFPQQTFSLSEIGEAFLNAHEPYIQLHKHKNWGISWQEYDIHVRQGMGFYDTVWGIFNKRLLNDRDYGRNTNLCMFQLLEEEGRYKDALVMIMRVFYIDLSGVDGLRYLDLYRSGINTKNDILDYFDVSVMLAPGIIQLIAKYKSEYTDDIIQQLYRQKLPVNVCNQKLFTTIVSSIMNGSYNDATVKAQLRSAYNKAFRALMS